MARSCLNIRKKTEPTLQCQLDMFIDYAFAEYSSVRYRT